MYWHCIWNNTVLQGLAVIMMLHQMLGPSTFKKGISVSSSDLRNNFAVLENYDLYVIDTLCTASYNSTH